MTIIHSSNQSKGIFNYLKSNLLLFIIIVLLLQSTIVYFLYYNHSFFNNPSDNDNSYGSNSFIQNDLTPFVEINTAKVDTMEIEDLKDLNNYNFNNNNDNNKNNKISSINKKFIGPFFSDIKLLKDYNHHIYENTQIPSASLDIIHKTIGNAFAVNFPDLSYRSTEEIKQAHPLIFDELKSVKLIESKNPCWRDESKDKSYCLPYFYILGQPKSGTSDLFRRLILHPDIIPPARKEVRWFTRGEFSFENLEYQDERPHSNQFSLGKSTSILDYANSFKKLASEIETGNELDSLITLDGGPHLLWWPIQQVDGQFFTRDIPTPQLLREIHSTINQKPRFLVTLTDPVKRMFSDYYFLNDDLKPVNFKDKINLSKSSKQFHDRSVKQVKDFNDCLEDYLNILIDDVDQQILRGEFSSEELEKYENLSHEMELSIPTKYYKYLPFWFRASQFCAHDRKTFALGGHGRLSISLYSLFIEKFYEHFSPEDILIMNLEDYDKDPKSYMQKIYDFLHLETPSSLDKILFLDHANVNKNDKEPLMEETEILLRNFYKPYNQILASMLNNPSFLWKDINLRQNILDKKRLEQSTETQYDYHNGNRFNHEHTEENEISEEKPHLRMNFKFNPQSFSLDGLRIDSNPPNLDISKYTTEEKLAQDLCISAYKTDFSKLQYLLHTVGINPNLKLQNGLNAFHCLSYIFNVGEAHSRSYIFAELKGVHTWLTDLFEPKMDVQSNSILSRNITAHLMNRVMDTAKWLDRAGVDINAVGDQNLTPIHIASYGGLNALVTFFAERGANVNAISKTMRTPAHHAAAFGHIHTLKILKDYDADFNIPDLNGITVLDIVINPGPILPHDAKNILNISQRKARQIKRVLNPELYPNEEYGWVGGTGGYGTERLKGYETDLDCTLVDQYEAHEITGEEIFYKYIARNSPVLVRGLFNHWEAITNMNTTNLMNKHGDLQVQVSNIPYAAKFGTPNVVTMKLKDYIQDMISHRIIGGEYPWYVFKGYPVPSQSERADSVLPYETCTFSEKIIEAFNLNAPNHEKIPSVWENGKIVKLSKQERELFVNAQWAVGGEGTGAPVHFHNTAMNTLIYGAKKWLVYPPANMIMSNTQIKDFFEHEYQFFYDNDVKPTTCVQLAGETMIIPESWGHGVLNIQESVAIASEFRYSQFRIHSFPLMSKVSNFDNKKLSQHKN